MLGKPVKKVRHVFHPEQGEIYAVGFGDKLA